MNTTQVLSLGLASVMTGFVPVTGSAQTRACTVSTGEVRSLAERFAPVYWFSPGERYFPVMPFFTAFDDADNDGDGIPDLDDPDEIAPLDAEGRPSWDRLDGLYHGNLPGSDKRLKYERPAVFYQVRDMEDGWVRDLWRYLKNDDQAWKRIIKKGMPDDLLRLLRDSAAWRSYEYFAYYLNDWGLIGHPYDVEFATIFAPADTGLAKRFRVFVGAGHTRRVPNNVLVLHGELAAREVTAWPDPKIDPAEQRPRILVELGDHSSAPDVDPPGQFHPGLDANWQIHDLWGTRDVQASAGVGFLGTYQPWMTLPRTEANSAVFHPPGITAEVVRETIMKQQALQARTERLAEEGDALATYALLPGALFECLVEALERDAKEDVESILEEIQSAIGDQRIPGWGEQWSAASLGSGLELSDSSYARMRLWSSGLYQGDKKIKRDQVLLWSHEHYTHKPTRAFKQHLFRPVWENPLERPGFLLGLINVWYTWIPGKAFMWQSGVEVPQILPVRLPGYLEAQAGVYCSQFVCDRRRSFSASLLHTGHYNAGLTYYGRLSYIPRRQRIDENDAATDFTISGGLAIVPASLQMPFFLRPFRLRFGVVADVFGGVDKVRIANLELIVAPLDTPKKWFVEP